MDVEFVPQVLIPYGKDLFQSGRSYSKFAETINGISALKPLLRRQMTSVWDLALNWVINEPHEHDAAMLLSVLLAIAGLSLLWGWVQEACVLLMQRAGLLRIGEIFLPSEAT